MFIIESRAERMKLMRVLLSSVAFVLVACALNGRGSSAQSRRAPTQLPPLPVREKRFPRALVSLTGMGDELGRGGDVDESGHGSLDAPGAEKVARNGRYFILPAPHPEPEWRNW